MHFGCGEAEEDHAYVTSRVGRDGALPFPLLVPTTATAIRLPKMAEAKEEVVLWLLETVNIKSPEAGWEHKASATVTVTVTASGSASASASTTSRSQQAASAAPARPLTARMASSVKTFLACSLLAFVSVHAAQRSHPRDTSIRDAAAAPVVTVKNGSYEGVYSAEYDQDFFLGMRYAEVCIE